MFPCGHLYYSMLAEPSAPTAQLIGALLPDAATTGAISWTDLHQPANVDDFERSTEGDPELAKVITGVRHHVALDHRSHDSWNGGGGFSYDKQTPELRREVQLACHVDDDLARSLAHNFIETAVDLHVLRRHPELSERLRPLATYDFTTLGRAIANWKQTDSGETASRLHAFFGTWERHDLSTVDGMVEVWTELMEVLYEHTFTGSMVAPLDREHARKAIELAMDITATEAIDVLTP